MIATVTDIKTTVDLPDDIKSSAVKFSEGEFLHNIIKKNNFKKTLETGFGLGLSACHIITATDDQIAKLSARGKSLNQFSLETVKMFYNDAQKAGFKL